MRLDGAVEHIKRDITVDTCVFFRRIGVKARLSECESYFNSISIIRGRKLQILP